MPKKIKNLILFLTLLFLYSFTAMSQQNNMLVLKKVPAPMAFFKEDNLSVVNVSFSDDGNYVLANTAREAKVWRLPQGELVYRYNTQMEKGNNNGVYSINIKSVNITANNKYIYVEGTTWADAILMPADLVTGEILNDGLIKDSLKSGAYQLKYGLRNMSELGLNFLIKIGEPNSPLVIKREHGSKYDERVNILAATASADYEGEIIICYKQWFCGTNKFIRDKMDKSVNSIREEQNQRRGCDMYHDVHIARYNPVTNTSVYLGNFIKGVMPIDFEIDVNSVTPSPFGDVVYVKMQGKKPVDNFYSVDGKLLWQNSNESYTGFQKFDDFGNAMFYTYKNNSKYLYIRQRITGDTLTTFGPLPEKGLYNSIWNLTAVDDKTEDNNFSLALYDCKTGEHFLSLTDEGGAAAFAKKFTKLVADQKAAEKARIDASYKYYNEQIERNAYLARVYQQKVIADAKLHNELFMKCPKCEGRGCFVKTWYSSGGVNVTYGSSTNTNTGTVTTVRQETRTEGGTYSSSIKCFKCNGRGEIRR